MAEDSPDIPMEESETQNPFFMLRFGNPTMTPTINPYPSTSITTPTPKKRKLCPGSDPRQGQAPLEDRSIAIPLPSSVITTPVPISSSISSPVATIQRCNSASPGIASGSTQPLWPINLVSGRPQMSPELSPANRSLPPRPPTVRQPSSTLCDGQKTEDLADNVADDDKFCVTYHCFCGAQYLTLLSRNDTKNEEVNENDFIVNFKCFSEGVIKLRLYERDSFVICSDLYI